MAADAAGQRNPFSSLSTYERRHLITHLIRADDLSTAHRVLALETGRQGNGWYQIKEVHGEVGDFVVDVNRVWRESERKIERQAAGGAGQYAVGWPLRYALMTTSINSLALNIPPGLMRAAVARGIWPPATALAYIRQMPDARQQLQTTLRLLPDLPGEALLDAFSLVRHLFSGSDQTRGLAALAPSLPAAREEALAQIEALADDAAREALAASLIRYLAAAGQLPDALPLLEGLGGSQQTAETLAQIAPHVGTLSRAEQQRILDLVRAMRSSMDQATALVAILPFLQPGRLPAVQEVARKMRSRPAKIETLAAVAERAKADQKRHLMDQALEAVQDVGDAQERARLLALLAPHLTPGQGKMAVAAASEYGDAEANALAFAALASFLTEEQIAQALQGLNERSPTRMGWALGHLAPYASGAAQRRLLEMAKSLENRSIRGPLLLELAGQVSGRRKKRLEKAGLEAVQELRKPQRRAKALVATVPHLPASLWEEVMAIVQRMRNDEARAMAVAGLAGQAPEDLIDALRETAEAIGSFAERAEALDSLAPRFSDDRLRETLASVLAIGDSEEQAWLLVANAPFVAQNDRVVALERIGRVEDDISRAQMLAQLAAFLAPEDLQRLCDMAPGVKNEYSRVRVLIAWAERAAPDEVDILEEAADHLEYDYARALLMAATAQYANGRQRENLVRKALRAAEGVWPLEDRVSLLGEMAEYVSIKRLARIVTAEAEKMARPQHRVKFPWFGQDLEQELHSGLDMDMHNRGRGLSAAALRLAGWEMPAEALKAARAITSNHERAEALVALLPFLQPSQARGVIEDALQAIREIARSKEVLIYRDSEDVMERWMGPTALAWLVPHASLEQEAKIEAIVQLFAETWVPGEFSGYDVIFGEGVTTARNILELDQERLAWVRQRMLEAEAELAVRKSETERERVLQRVLEQIPDLGHDPVRALAIHSIAGLLPATLLPTAVDIILQFDSDYGAAQALSAFAPLLDEQSIADLMDLAVSFPTEEARDVLLLALVSRIAELGAVEAALEAAQMLGSAGSRYRAFAELSPLLEQMPPSELIRLWQAPRPTQTLLASVAGGNRPEHLVQLQPLAPIIYRLGGQEACRALNQAVQDVSRWWP